MVEMNNEITWSFLNKGKVEYHSQVTDDLLCDNCDKIMILPKVCKCGQSCCQNCIEISIKCRTSNDGNHSFKEDSEIGDKIFNLYVVCPNDYCEKPVRVKKLRKHLQKCDRISIVGGSMKENEDLWKESKSLTKNMNDSLIDTNELSYDIKDITNLVEVINLDSGAPSMEQLKTLVETIKMEFEEEMRTLRKNLQNQDKQLEKFQLEHDLAKKDSGRAMAQLRKEVADLRSTVESQEDQLNKLRQRKTAPTDKATDSVSEELTQIRTRVQKQEETCRSLKEQGTRAQKERSDTSRSCEQVHRRLDSMDRRYAEMSCAVPQSELTQHRWELPASVAELEVGCDEVWSMPVYVCGFRLQLSLGVPDEEGACEARVWLMAGDLDSEVGWPLNHTVTVGCELDGGVEVRAMQECRAERPVSGSRRLLCALGPVFSWEETEPGLVVVMVLTELHDEGDIETQLGEQLGETVSLCLAQQKHDANSSSPGDMLNMSVNTGLYMGAVKKCYQLPACESSPIKEDNKSKFTFFDQEISGASWAEVKDTEDEEEGQEQNSDEEETRATKKQSNSTGAEDSSEDEDE